MNVALNEISETALDLSLEHKAVLDEILAENKDKPGATMVVLTLTQEKLGYVSSAMQRYLSKALGVPLSHLYGVLG